MHHQIDSLAYTNKLRHLPPQHKLIFAIALFCLGYITANYIKLLIFGWLIISTVVYAGIPWQVYRQLLLIPLTFWLTSLPALLIGISFDRSIFITDSDIWHNLRWNLNFAGSQLSLYISNQGLHQGIDILCNSLCLTACMYFILLTIPFTEIIQILNNWKFPKLITELMLLMYRFIFVLTQTATELIQAQKSRFGYLNWQTTIKSISLIIGQLLRRSLVNYRQISLALASRGFTGELKLWNSRSYRPNWRYIYEAYIGYSLLIILSLQHYWN